MALNKATKQLIRERAYLVLEKRADDSLDKETFGYKTVLKGLEIRADMFYERVKDKPLKVIKRYLILIQPRLDKGIQNLIDWHSNSERVIRYAAAYRAAMEFGFDNNQS